MQASRVADMKFNVDEERNLYRWRTELEQMRASLKSEQGEEVWEEEELNSEVYVPLSLSLLHSGGSLNRMMGVDYV